MSKIRIGISTGDINGVSLEVILKTLQNKKLLQYCTPIIYGSSKVTAYHRNIVGIDDMSLQNLRSAERPNSDKVNVVNCWEEDINITIGKPTEESGQFSIKALEAAMNDLKAGLIDALVTAPINKEAMKMANFPFPGHTEYITEQLGAKVSLMLMINDVLRIGVVTNHLPLRDVVGAVTKELVAKKIAIFNKTLKEDFGINRPTIGVLALNPHASDGGAIGDEEEKIIRPALIEAKKKGILAMGPFPADGFFGAGKQNKFDGVLAMYHDQGLVPFKALSFGAGVNFTAGLSHVRTSPDHGTAYDIAGKNEASPDSFRRALFLAIDVVKNRNDFEEMHANSVQKSDQPLEQSPSES